MEIKMKNEMKKNSIEIQIFYEKMTIKIFSNIWPDNFFFLHNSK